MNIVKQMRDEVSGETLGKLSSLLGVEDEAADVAAHAAGPALLASLTGLAAPGKGAEKLTDVLDSLDEFDFAAMLDADSSALLQKGGDLLNNLFGEGMLNNLSDAVARFAGIGAGAARNLLAYLAPLVLGRVATLWRSRGGDAEALPGLLAEQKNNIADAMPAGFSLAGVPELAKFRDTVRPAAGSQTTAPSTAGWAIPLAILALGAFLLWAYMRPKQVAEMASPPEPTTAMKPVVTPETPQQPDVKQLTDSLQSIFQSAGETFAKIEDAATAEAAQPQLRELNDQLDAAIKELGKLPQLGQSLVRNFVKEQFALLREQKERVSLIPAVKSEVKTLIDEIVNKIKQLSGENQASP